MKNLLILFFLTGIIASPHISVAQNNLQPEKVNYYLTVYKDPILDTFVSRIYYANYPRQIIKGYRVQIYSGSNRVDANKIKSDFLETYMGEKIYFDYKQPYYKVRVGDYRTKVEAQKMYQLLLLDARFKGVLIVPDDINFPELKTSN
jgi:hypothetical protein